MAGTFQQLLRGAVNGFLESPNLKDYTHANKTFVSKEYDNAPKYKWLFHVYFKINQKFAGDDKNFGLLVKNVELPKFDVKVEEMNQYNRKRYIQTKITYQPIRIIFHDDNAGQLKRLWEEYFRYYYYDSQQPTQTTGASKLNSNNASELLNRKNIYDNELDPRLSSWGYSGDSDKNSKESFFEKIQVYGFNQHKFARYDIINPIIENFSHDTYNYNETTSTMENSMSIRYETVKYYDGALNGQKPWESVNGFGDPKVYDTNLSPIARPGANKSIVGPGGVVDAGKGILSDLESGDILGAIQKAGRVSNTFRNTKDIVTAAKSELLNEAIKVVSNPETIRNTINIPVQNAYAGLKTQISKYISQSPAQNRTPPFFPEN